MSTPTTKTKRTGDTMSGTLKFSGTTHGGVGLIPLTTAQRDALTPGAAEHFAIFNTSTGAVNIWDGAAWDVAADAGSFVAKAGDTMTGTLQIDSGANPQITLTHSTGSISCIGTTGTQIDVKPATQTVEIDGADGITVILNNNRGSSFADAHIYNGAGNIVLGQSGDAYTAGGAWGSTVGAVFIGDCGTLPSGNPANNFAAFMLDGNALFYRTAGSSEGIGANNYLHNRTDGVVGAGTAYSLTGSTARVDFGTTDAEVVLPTAGTYLLLATVQIQGDALGASDEIRVKLRNSTDASDVGVERSVTTAVASSFDPIDLLETVTVTASKTIQIFAFNTSSARGTIIAAKTAIRYVRLH